MARIAVVDDNPGARHFAAACLKSAGHEIQELEPTCLFDLLAVLHPNPPEVLITDLIMPGCPGQTLIRACREDAHFKDLKILLLTAHGDQKLAKFLRGMGNIHYLSKPVAPAALADCVDRFLSGDLEVDPGWTLSCRGVVAVVDDSRLSRTFHAACLRKQGFRPLEIDPQDLTTVLHTLDEGQPNLLLLDFLMPRFRGDALIRALRASEKAHLRELPILMVTAHQPSVDQEALQRSEGVEVLSKPIAPERLIAKVCERLGLGDSASH